MILGKVQKGIKIVSLLIFKKNVFNTIAKIQSELPKLIVYRVEISFRYMSLQYWHISIDDAQGYIDNVLGCFLRILCNRIM